LKDKHALKGVQQVLVGLISPPYVVILKQHLYYR